MTATPTLAGALRGSLAVRVERETNEAQRIRFRAALAELDGIELADPPAREVAR